MKVACALQNVVEQNGKGVDEKDPGEKVDKKKTFLISRNKDPLGRLYQPMLLFTGTYPKCAGNAL